MSNLLFSMNATMPIFFILLLGVFFRKVGMIDDTFASKMNGFVFKIALPVNLFNQFYPVDFLEVWDGKFIIFCFAATLGSIFIAFLCSLLLKKKSERGEFIQASYRSSASLLGMAYLQNMYPNVAMGSLMMIGSVPLYNIAAVVILSLTDPRLAETSARGGNKKSLMLRAVLGIFTNPILLGIVIGFLWSVLGIPMPAMLGKTTSMIGQLSSPMGILAMGASIDFKKARGEIGPALGASFLKLVGFVLLVTPAAILLGFREQQLIAVLIMAGSGTTVSSFVMARSMGHDGTLTSTTVLITTLLSAGTLTLYIFILRTLGYV